MTTEAQIIDRKATEHAWAAHLDTCMDMTCATCAEYEAAIYNTTTTQTRVTVDQDYTDEFGSRIVVTRYTERCGCEHSTWIEDDANGENIDRFVSLGRTCDKHSTGVRA